MNVFLRRKMKILTWVLIVVIITSVDSACEICNRCVNDRCRNPNNNQCYCVDGCKPGYYGGICKHICPEQCVSCGREYGASRHPTYHICYECKDGYHNGSSTNCAAECPVNCQQCSSNTNCTVCINGWYGSVCASRCPNCHDDACSKTDGSCTLGCKNGWYGPDCTLPCPAKCKDVCDQISGTCINGCIDNFAPGDGNLCNICVAGKYGSNCNIDCKNCKDEVCDRDSGLCKHGCMDNFVADNRTVCNICITGKYGSKCSLDCRNCKNNVCDRHSGVCIDGCIDNFTPGDENLCTVCITGNYGTNCDIQCRNCKNGVCDRYSGICTHGCNDNFVFDSKRMCSACIPGKYGDNCDLDCLSTTCLNDECDQSSGKCTEGCKTNYAPGGNNLCHNCVHGKYESDCNASCPSRKCLNNECEKVNGTCTQGCVSTSIIGDYCNNCVNGTFDDNCQSICPINCKYTVCSRDQGTCSIGCTSDQFTGNKCEHCIAGFYGEHCNTSCPSNCKGDVCKKENGNCLDGCVGNFTGKKCDVCRDGYYGTNCSIKCPLLSGCFNGVCNRSTAHCDVCKPGMYGIFCNLSCSPGCSGNNCEQLSGNCSKGCHGNYTGDKCCSLNGHCERCENTTQCAKCIPGYFGINCNMSCPTNCLQGCEKQTGECLACTHRYHGPKCDIECSDKCYVENNETICDFETGKCLHGCLKGHTNVNCTENCSTNCLDGECDQDTGFCSICLSGYYGNQCDSECSEQCVNTTCSQTDGKCHHGCSDGFEEPDCTKESPVVDDSGNVAGPVAGGVSGALVLIAIIFVGCLVFRKWKSREDKQPHGSLDQFSSVNDIPNTPELDTKIGRATNDYQNTSRRNKEDHNYIELMNEGHHPDVEGTEEVDVEYANIDPSTKIKLAYLYRFVTNKDTEFFKREFQQLPQSTSHTFSVARKSENRALNRFKGIYPYDHTRVKLKDDPTFFINACYINGYNTTKAYIASVGPTAEITNRFISFWKMVWYENAEVIVMLTNMMETTGMKCERYWPEVNTSNTYGDITVTHQGSSEYAEYTLTNMTVTKGQKERSLTHMHYTAWPDKSVPDNVLSLVVFRQRVKALKTDNGGPTIVHCSAGVGRTGTYIALDILTDQGKTEQAVNVLDCVKTLREQRVSMVQTHEQYQYLYRGIVYTLIFGSEPVTIDNIQTFMASKEDSFYTEQFQELGLEIEMESEDEKEAKEANRLHSDKNRQGADIPGNIGRPRLFLNRAFNEPDYINAVYMNSFKKTNRYISAQTPLPTSLSDFLCLIYQNKCSCIIDMNDVVSYNQHKVDVYLPDVNQTMVVDSFTISCSRLQTKNSYTKSILTINNTSKQMPCEIRVEHYQYTGWRHEREVPDNVNEFVQFVNTVQVAADNQSEDSSPMLIHCMNAFERSGLFCTTAVLLEKLECEQQVSFSNTVRHVRLVRNKAIPNKAQYQFCHQCATAYIDLFSTYSNFAM